MNPHQYDAGRAIGQDQTRNLYANQAQQQIIGATADRPMTEMESLSANLADHARRLAVTNDRLQGRVDSFMQTAQPLTSAKDAPAPEPQPGTIGAIKFWTRQIEEQAQRLSTIESNLAGIL